jgi:diguanylate cyclase (GGDEF)-like protein
VWVRVPPRAPTTAMRHEFESLLAHRPTEQASRRVRFARNGLPIAAIPYPRYAAEVSERVLVVDDDDGVRQVVVEALSDAGYECVDARDGIEGLRLARAQPPDMVVLDVVMPQMSGDDVQRALRRDLATRYVPVIFLSAQSAAPDKARRLLDGADDYMAKPFDTDELVARVTTALRRSTSLRALNPLSGLPGNVAIMSEIERRLADGSGSVCLYCDLDHFKQFNDHYGFARGDQLIVLLGRLLVVTAEGAGADAFVGHVGGDDYVLVVPGARAEDVARTVIRAFDEMVPTVYDDDDRARGYIVRTDRHGIEHNLPFVTVSIGIVPITPARFSDAVAVSRAAAEVKEIAKRRDGSSWAVDRRQASAGSPTMSVG